MGKKIVLRTENTADVSWPLYAHHIPYSDKLILPLHDLQKMIDAFFKFAGDGQNYQDSHVNIPIPFLIRVPTHPFSLLPDGEMAWKG